MSGTSPAHNATDEATRETAAALLAAGTTVKKTASTIGVRRETVHTWLRDPDFAARVRAIGEVIAGVVKARAEALAHEALDVVAGRMRDPKELGAVRVKAATYILDRVVPPTNEAFDERLQAAILEIFGVLAGAQPAEAYSAGLEALKNARIGQTKRLPQGVVIRVEREGEK